MSNETVLVTGGGSGIGRDIALRLADEGADIIIVGRTEAPLKETASQHNRINHIVADIGNPKHVAQVYAAFSPQ